MKSTPTRAPRARSAVSAPLSVATSAHSVRATSSATLPVPTTTVRVPSSSSARSSCRSREHQGRGSRTSGNVPCAEMRSNVSDSRLDLGWSGTTSGVTCPRSRTPLKDVHPVCQARPRLSAASRLDRARTRSRLRATGTPIRLQRRREKAAAIIWLVGTVAEAPGSPPGPPQNSGLLRPAGRLVDQPQAHREAGPFATDVSYRLVRTRAPRPPGGTESDPRHL